MNKKLLITLISLSVALGATAKGLDLQSRIMLKRHALEKAQINSNFPVKAAKGLKIATADDGRTVLAMVALQDGFTSSDLEAAGMSVKSLRGGVAVVGLPVDSVESWANLPCIKKMSLQRELNTNTNLARQESGVDAIHNGVGLDLPYTGKGVLTAIVDEGVDPNNISFLDADGKTRVKYLTYYDGTADRYGNPNYDLYGEDIYDEDASGNIFWYPTVDKFTTDGVGAYHGTHTMNILAGAYKGDVEMSIGLNGTNPVFEKVKNPFYGVATDSEMAVSCGSLADACVALGINGILDYAWYRKHYDGMPSVLSLSLGSTGGPHDPNGLMNRFLEACGDETIVVIAAGNEGDLKIALTKDMKEGDTSMASMIYPYYYRYDPSQPAGQRNTYVRTGAIMIYSKDKTPFKINAFVMTGSQGNYRKRATFDISSEEGSYFLSNSYYADYVGGMVNSTVQRYFDGYIGGGSMYDEDLGRYYGVFDYYLYTNPETGFNEDGSEGVIVGFEVIGEDGQRIECYGDGYNTWMYNYGMDAYMDGQRDGTISDMAVGKNVLVVGAYTLRNRWTNLNGEDYGYLESDGFVNGDIGQYTSYGTLADGRTLPHVCAPGSAVISAVSRPYVESYFKGYENYIPQNFVAKASVGGNNYYWKPETGTSMSTPFVAGSIALWLEADPSLKYADVMDIIRTTAVRDEFVENGNQVQWGYGKFDAVAGLKEVIRRRAGENGINGISLDGHNDRLILQSKGYGLYDIFVGEAAGLDIKVYSMGGALVYAGSADGCETLLDLGSLGKGIYVINVNGHSRKITL